MKSRAETVVEQIKLTPEQKEKAIRMAEADSQNWVQWKDPDKNALEGRLDRLLRAIEMDEKTGAVGPYTKECVHEIKLLQEENKI